jgi:hypothetical protein
MKCLNCGKDCRKKYCSNACQRQFETGVIKKFIVYCHNCGEEIEIYEKEKLFPIKEKYFCSKSCANSRHWNEEHKNKISLINKKSKNVSKANKTNGKNKRLKYILKRVSKTCPVCGKNFELNKTYCSRECYISDKSMMYRNSGIGGYRKSLKYPYKRGLYDGQWFDSSWELAFYLYNKDKGIILKKNTDKFTYFFEGKKCSYLPDFKLNEKEYIELKGYLRKRDEFKISQFPHNLKIYKSEEMRKIISYVVFKYGKNFISLYEDLKNKDEIKNLNIKNRWNIEEIQYLKNNTNKNIEKMKFLLKRHTIDSIKSKIKRLKLNNQ